MSYLVTAPLVVSRSLDGDVLYSYEGANITEIDLDNAVHLLDAGLIVEVDDPAVVTDDPADDVDPNGPPPKAGSKELWVDYAVARAVAEGKDADKTRAQAEAMTKQDLQAALA